MYLFNSVDPDDFDIVVPEEFATILKVALSKMVASKCLKPEMINLDFWRRMPSKFKGIRYYEDVKKKNREVCCCLFMELITGITCCFFFNRFWKGFQSPFLMKTPLL